MTDRLRKALPVALTLLALGAAPAALAVPVTVNLRVEGSAKTVFDGPVVTDAKTVTTAAGGTHACDGTVNGDGLPPGPTATTALDDGAILGGFSWDGSYDSGYQDYFVSRIADETADPSSEFWALFIDREESGGGGCHTRVNNGQEVLWARVGFLGPRMDPLELSGPDAAATGQPVNVRVVNGVTEAPEAGANVNGSVTGPDGVATLTFPDEGIYRLKAEKPGTVRSNTIVLCVDPPGAAECTSGDKSAPALSSGFGAGDPALPGRHLASRDSRSRTILVSWAGQDGDGSGVSTYTVEVSEANRGVRSSQAEPEWRTLLDQAPVNGLHFRGDRGAAYRFRITATDRALNATTITTDPVLIPVDDRDRRILRLSKRWKRTAMAAAWGRKVARATRAGATARMRFTGTQVALIGRRLPKGGRLRVSVDGTARTIRARGRSRHRSVLWVSRRLEPGDHTLRLRTLGGGPVELDAVAPSP